MAKYRIKIEALDPAEELRAEYRIGWECDKFVILSETEGKGIVEQALHDVDQLKIAEMIKASPEMMASAMIARAMHEASEYMRKNELAKNTGNLLARIFGGEED